MSRREQWKAWTALDEGRADRADGPEARLDALLKEAGARARAEKSDGRMRWRVLGAIGDSSAPSAAATGRRWNWRATSAAAVVALGVGGAAWMWGQTGQTAPAPTTPRVTAPVVEGTRGTGRMDLRAMPNPIAALAARIEHPLEKEKDRLVSSAKQVATFFADRVTFPISALQRKGGEVEEHQGLGGGSGA